MDGRKTGVKLSIQSSLNRRMLLATAIFALLSGSISGWNAYEEAKEQQDNLLIQVANLVVSGSRKLNVTTDTDIDPEDTLILQSLGTVQSHSLPISIDTPDGMHSLTFDEEAWRTLVVSAPPLPSGEIRRYAVSQKLEARNELAWENSLRTLLPIILLVPLLMWVISITVNRSFLSVRNLAEVVDARDETRLDALSESQVPQEIIPFVESINRLLHRLELAINQQQRFVADAAHELRTPMAGLSLLVDNLVNVSTVEEMQKRLSPLQAALSRMRKLIAQLLDLARLQGNGEAIQSNVDVQKIVQNVIADLYPLAEAKSIDLGMLRNEPLKIVAFPEGLRMLVHNAIDNAILYTPSGGRVDVSVYTQADELVFLVEDSGPGIPEPLLSDVFEPFYRVGLNGEPGNGLGLAISLEIAQRMAGKIVLSNRPHGGLAFRFNMPLMK